MIPPPDRQVKILHAALDDAGEAARLMASGPWLSSARVVKQTDRTSVLAGEINGRGVIVKTLRLRPRRDLLSRWAGRTRLGRQLRGAQLLQDADIPTAAPLLFLRGGRRDQRGTFEALVLEELEGKTLLRVIADGGLGVRQEHALADAAGRLTAKLECSLIDNRDHKPSNIIARGEVRGGPVKLVIIDTVGIRTKNVRQDRMLANLVWELVGTTLLPRRGLLMRALMSCLLETDRLWSEASRDFHKRADRGALRLEWRRIEKQVREHGDCTPKDDPLADG